MRAGARCVMTSPIAEMPGDAGAEQRSSTAMNPRSSVEARLVGAEPVGHRRRGRSRRAASSTTSDVALAAGRCISIVTPAALDRRRRDLRRRSHRDAALLERLLELGRDRVVLVRHEARQELDHRHLAAEPTEDRRELDADGTAAEDRDRLRHLGEVNRFVAGDDVRPSISMPGTLARRRAGGDDDLARGERARRRRRSPRRGRRRRAGRCP